VYRVWLREGYGHFKFEKARYTIDLKREMQNLKAQYTIGSLLLWSSSSIRGLSCSLLATHGSPHSSSGEVVVVCGEKGMVKGAQDLFID
jgi:hypothetical protein